MKKQSLYKIGLFLWVMSLASSACQPQAFAKPVSNTPTIQPAMPKVTATAQPTPQPEAKVLWTFQTKGAVWGTPAVHAGTVYIGSDDGNLYAIEVQNSQLKWTFATEGIVRSTPAFAGELVYIASDDGYVYAINSQSGKQAWRTDIGNFMARQQRENLPTSTAPTGFDYFQSSPIAVDGQVFVGSMDGKVYALAAGTGKIDWTFQTGEKVRATPVVDNGIVYIGSWDKSVYALDAQTGKARWSTPIGGQVQSNALVANGLVYCASRKASVVALDVQTGKMKWEYDYGNNMWVESSPALSGGILYIGSSGSRMVVGLDSQTGKIVTIFTSHTFNWSIPAIKDNILYFGGAGIPGDEKGGLFAIRLVNGKFENVYHYRWNIAIAETLETTGVWNGVASSPVIADGVIYFGGLDGKLYAARDG